MEDNNKRILLNTGVMYGRLIITTIVGLLTSRFVLQALGASDYGLYAVVGGLIAMLNVLSTAMTTTTRRFINVEMGKPDGNLNRIFNISRVLHFGFAFFIIIVAETIGLFYIYHYLNVEPGKLNDAVFVFQVSVIAAAIGVNTVPFQALLEAKEKFTTVALLDVLRVTLGLSFVFILFLFSDSRLRIYSIGMGLITLVLFINYFLISRYHYKEIVKYKFYKEKSSYKEIFIFNNYVALGATSYLSRTQASSMLVNFFFGTIANAAFAIAYTMESFCISFVTNIGTAAAPQITSNFEHNNNRSFLLTASLHRISVYLMTMMVVPLSLELEFVLELWLKDVPEGALSVCHLTLLSALVRVVFGGTDKFVQASGKIKWFQIINSTLELMCIPISYFLFYLGYAPYTIIVVYIISTVVCNIITFTLMRRLLKVDVKGYIKLVYIRVGAVLICAMLYALCYYFIPFNTIAQRLLGMVLSAISIAIIVYFVGMNPTERNVVNRLLSRVLSIKKK